MSFGDVFKSSFLDNISQFSVLDMVVAMAASCIIGLFILFVYKHTFSGVAYSSSFAASLPGLAMVTTLVILAVTSNVVLSLGMVGALSIVRFRSAIKDPMEIVFLFWALAVGIVNGAGMLPLAVLGSFVIGIILIIIVNHKSHNHIYILVVRSKDESTEEKCMECVKKKTKAYELKSKVVNKESRELAVEVKLKEGENGLLDEVLSMETVESAVLVSYNGEYMY